MSRYHRVLVSSLCFLFLSAGIASAQSTAPASAQSGTVAEPDGWHVTVYPLLVWVPIFSSLDFSLPPLNGGDGNRRPAPDIHLEGAYLGGVSVAHGIWRFDVDGIWAAIGGDRVDRPAYSVDADFYYVYGSAGIKVAKDLYATGGVRRLAVKYNFTVSEGTDFSRKIGVWDPIVGVGYHRVAKKYELNGVFEAGGFGVGTDWEYDAGFRAEWKPVTHFGLTGGYNFLKFKVSDDVAERELLAWATLHGPSVGIGLYF